LDNEDIVSIAGNQGGIEGAYTFPKKVRQAPFFFSFVGSKLSAHIDAYNSKCNDGKYTNVIPRKPYYVKNLKLRIILNLFGYLECD